MSNGFYNHGSIPADNSLGSSAEIRAEFDSVAAAFDKMPTLTSNGGKLVKINAGATALEAQATDAFVADAIHAATSKTTPVDADEFGIVDSAASNVLKKLTWANLKATLKTYFDTLYHTVGGALGTPASGTLTNCTGLPPTGLSSTTGSGAAVLANSPTLVTPNLGTPSVLVGTNITGTAAGLSIGGNAATATSATNVYQDNDPAAGTYRVLLGNGTDANSAVHNFSALYYNSTAGEIQGAGANISGNAATATTATTATSVGVWADVSGLGVILSGNGCTVSRTATGNYRITFSVAFADVNYLAIGSAHNVSLYGSCIVTPIKSDVGYSDVLITDYTGVSRDVPFSVMFFR